MQQSLAVAHDKQQHTDRTPFCADQQQNIEYILHCCHGLPHPFIWFQRMDAFIDSTIQLLIEWGLPGLFISALLAGSIVPFSSELVLVALVKLGLPPTACILAATLGNTAGGMTCYYMGRLGKISWIEKYFKVKKEKVDKMVKFLQGKGALMAFFAFLPAIGEVISIALGFMRSNIWLTTASMFVGKLIRYILLLYVLESAWNVVAG